MEWNNRRKPLLVGQGWEQTSTKSTLWTKIITLNSFSDSYDGTRQSQSCYFEFCSQNTAEGIQRAGNKHSETLETRFSPIFICNAGWSLPASMWSRLADGVQVWRFCQAVDWHSTRFSRWPGNRRSKVASVISFFDQLRRSCFRDNRQIPTLYTLMYTPM